LNEKDDFCSTPDDDNTSDTEKGVGDTEVTEDAEDVRDVEDY
jgi:hypothetical protein